MWYWRTLWLCLDKPLNWPSQGALPAMSAPISSMFPVIQRLQVPASGDFSRDEINGCFQKSLLKWDDLGYHYFWKHPNRPSTKPTNLNQDCRVGKLPRHWQWSGLSCGSKTRRCQPISAPFRTSFWERDCPKRSGVFQWYYLEMGIDQSRRISQLVRLHSKNGAVFGGTIPIWYGLIWHVVIHNCNQTGMNHPLKSIRFHGFWRSKLSSCCHLESLLSRCVEVDVITAKPLMLLNLRWDVQGIDHKWILNSSILQDVNSLWIQLLDIYTLQLSSCLSSVFF